jgi:hypothetical protein
MERPHQRPRFRLRAPLPRAALVERLELALDEPGVGCIGIVTGRHLDLMIHPDARRAWSPRMDLELLDEGSETLMIGRIGPHPDVWSLFLFFYALSGFALIGGLMLGLSQWLIGQPPWGLWLVLLGASTSGLAYLAAFTGQRLGRPQMTVLRRFLEAALHDHELTEEVASNNQPTVAAQSSVS